MAFFGVNFILQKFCPCKKNDKYQVCHHPKCKWSRTETQHRIKRRCKQESSNVVTTNSTELSPLCFAWSWTKVSNLHYYHFGVYLFWQLNNHHKKVENWTNSFRAKRGLTWEPVVLAQGLELEIEYQREKISKEKSLIFRVLFCRMPFRQISPFQMHPSERLINTFEFRPNVLRI